MSLEERTVERLDHLISKGTAVLGTHMPNSPNVIGFPTLNNAHFAEWQTQVLSFLTNLLGKEHVYVKNFGEMVRSGYPGQVEMGQGILQAVKEDIENGYLTDVRTLLSAEVFTDFLEMAEHLQENGYKDPAASLTGAVLEDGLRKIATNNGISVRTREEISTLNRKIADSSTYSRLVQKKVQVWADIRNNADHGHFTEYSAEDVKAMIEGVGKFLADYLTYYVHFNILFLRKAPLVVGAC